MLPSTPPGEDGINDLYQHAAGAAVVPGSAPEATATERAPDYLHLISIAEQQANLEWWWFMPPGIGLLGVDTCCNPAC